MSLTPLHGAVGQGQAPGAVGESGTLTYAFQPRLGGGGTQIALKDDVLTYQVGARGGRIDLRDVAGVRLLFRPAQLAHSSFEMHVRTWDKRRVRVSSLSRVSLTQARDQSAEYDAFVRALHERLAYLDASGAILGHPKVDFRGGYSGARWWLAMILGIFVLAALVAVFGMALMDRQWVFAGVLALLSALMAQPTLEMIIRNRPVRYGPAEPPEQLLPG